MTEHQDAGWSVRAALVSAALGSLLLGCSANASLPDARVVVDGTSIDSPMNVPDAPTSVDANRDAGAADAGTPDAMVFADAFLPDAGTPDAMVFADASLADAGPPDAMVFADASLADAGPPDAGATDAMAFADATSN